MSKIAKILIASTCFIVAGILIFAIALGASGWDFSKMGNNDYQTKEHEITQEFNSLSLNTITADIILIPTTDEKCKVVCYENEKVKHTVTVENGALTVSAKDERKWFDYIGINWNSEKITVYLPNSEYQALNVTTNTGDVKIPKEFTFASINVKTDTGDVDCYASSSGNMEIEATTGDINVAHLTAPNLSVKVTTGDIEIENVVCNDLQVITTTGDVELSNILCNNFTSKGSTGDISLEKVIATESFKVERSTGDVELERCDGFNIVIKTDTGDVKGSFASPKNVIASSDTGSVRVPSDHSGERCEITTDTGDIKITISQS